jgi:hypothetical protein
VLPIPSGPESSPGPKVSEGWRRRRVDDEHDETVKRK